MWEEILKARIKMHLPTLKIKVAEWAEMNREGRHTTLDIINYIQEDVAKASVMEHVKKHSLHIRNFDKLLPNLKKKWDLRGIPLFATHISRVLTKMGFKKYKPNVVEMEMGTNVGRWQDIVDHSRMKQAIRREGKAPESRRYGGSASRFEENR